MIVRWFFLVLVAAMLGVEGAIDRLTKSSDKASESTTTYPVTPTVVAYTSTLAGGALQTLTTTYKQVFSTPYSALYTPSKGTIGLGSIQGAVGTPRPERIFTVTE